MKLTTHNTVVPVAALFLTLSLAAFAAPKDKNSEAPKAAKAPAAAVDEADAPGPGPGGPRQAQFEKMVRFWDEDDVAEELKLTQDQIQKLNENFDASKKTLATARPKLDEARKALRKAMQADSPDVGAVNSAIDELADAQKEVHKTMADYRVVMLNTLNAEQKEALKDHRREEMRDRWQQGRGGRGGRGQGGPGMMGGFGGFGGFDGCPPDGQGPPNRGRGFGQRGRGGFGPPPAADAPDAPAGDLPEVNLGGSDDDAPAPPPAPRARRNRPQE